MPTQRQPSSAEQPYLFPSELLVDIGEFKDIVREGEVEVQIGIEGDIDGPPHTTSKVPMRVGFDVHVQNNRLVYHKGSIESLPAALLWEFVPGALLSRPRISLEGAVLEFHPLHNFRLIGFTNADIPENLPPRKKVDIGELGRRVEAAPGRLLDSVHPIFPLRGFEEWGYPLPVSSASNLERLTLADRAMAMASMLAYNRALTERLSLWLEDLLQIGIRADLVSGPRVVIRASRAGQGDTTKLFANEGTGAHQLPFILIPIGLAPPGETLLLCEPEAHLHPRAQSHLVGLLLKIWKKERRQLFFETHSEHILHSLLHAVAKGDLNRNEVAIYYFENDQGVAKVRRLDMDEKGRVEGGLPGFFDHSLAELSEYIEALKKA